MFADYHLAALCITLVWIYQADGEPKCSSFHYEEKLLEKIIRVEFAMEKMKTEMVSIQDNVKATLAELNAERKELMKELRSELSRTQETRVNKSIDLADKKLQTKMEELNAERNKLMKQFSEFVRTTETRVSKTIDLADNKLQTKMEELNKLQTALEDKDKILFSVRYPKDTSLTSGQTMKYTTLLANDGDGYNKDTGVFTAPKAGLYLFNVQFCMHAGKHLDFAFVVGENSFKASRIQRKSWLSCYDYNVFKFLKVRDDVSIKIISCSSGDNLQESNIHYWNTFSGTYIHM